MSAPLLTDEQIIKCWGNAEGTRHGYVPFGRAIESAVRAPLLAEIERLQALFDAEVSAWRRVSEQNEIHRRELFAAIKRLTAERDAALADAERYRWLRSDAATTDKDCPAVYMIDEGNLLIGEELDAAIDAARSNQ